MNPDVAAAVIEHVRDFADETLLLVRGFAAHGFAAIDAAHVGGHLLLSAEVPIFGPRRHA